VKIGIILARTQETKYVKIVRKSSKLKKSPSQTIIQREPTIQINTSGWPVVVRRSNNSLM